jgi:hypothetical protein
MQTSPSASCLWPVCRPGHQHPLDVGTACHTMVPWVLYHHNCQTFVLTSMQVLTHLQAHTRCCHARTSHLTQRQSNSLTHKISLMLHQSWGCLSCPPGHDEGRESAPVTTVQAPVKPTNVTPPMKLPHKSAHQSPSFISIMIMMLSPDKKKSQPKPTSNLMSALTQAFDTTKSCSHPLACTHTCTIGLLYHPG